MRLSMTCHCISSEANCPIRRAIIRNGKAHINSLHKLYINRKTALVCLKNQKYWFRTKVFYDKIAS